MEITRKKKKEENSTLAKRLNEQISNILDFIT